MERTKHSDKRRKQSVDRLGALPDAILCHILSFLPTKQSVATSSLARRWRSLWTGVPTFDLDDRHYVAEDMSSSDIINRVMLLQGVPKMNTFRLVHSEKCSNRLLETWIAAAVAREVRNLDLYFYHVTELPRLLFTCRTLVDLRLHLCTCVGKGAGVCLLNLKKLHLCSVKYEDNESLNHLLSGCPALEDLLIDKFVRLGLSHFLISSATIKRLTINYAYEGVTNSQSYTYWYQVELNAPGLRYLIVKNCISEYILTAKLSSLVEADICFDLPKKSDSDPHRVFLYKLCDVKRLKLSNRNMKMPSDFLRRKLLFASCLVGCDPTLRFANLTKLEWDADWLILTNLLEKADNLEVLIIGEVDKDLKCWKDPRCVPACLLSRLRTVTINQFGCTKSEFEMVRYLLKNAKVLKKMEIYSGREGIDLEKKFNALQKISQIPRGFVACELHFF